MRRRIDTSQSKLGGNIDPRQMQELPINGRDWMGLSMLAPGSRVNQLKNERGTLADFIVIDKDYFTIPEQEIQTIQTLMTVIGG